MKSKMFFCAALVSMMVAGQFSNINVFANEATAVVAEQGNELSKTTIKLEGVIDHNYKPYVNLIFDTVDKKMKVKDFIYSGYGIHSGFGKQKYVEVKLYDENGNEKGKTLTLTGNENIEKVRNFATEFEYGDYVKVFHQEPHRLTINNVIDKKDTTNETLYRITRKGLEQTEISDLSKNTIELRGINIDHHKDHGFDLKFDTKEMKIKVDMKRADYQIPIHSNFIHQTYIEVKLYGKDGTLKKDAIIRGENSANYAKHVFKDFNFEYGDTIEIFHEEGTDWRYNVTGTITSDLKQKSKTYRYVISKDLGLIQTQIPSPLQGE